MASSVIFDSLESDRPADSNACRWRLVTDGVMGGLSEGTLTRETIGNRLALRMRGRVSLAGHRTGCLRSGGRVCRSPENHRTEQTLAVLPSALQGQTGMANPQVAVQ